MPIVQRFERPLLALSVAFMSVPSHKSPSADARRKERIGRCGIKNIAILRCQMKLSFARRAFNAAVPDGSPIRTHQAMNFPRRGRLVAARSTAHLAANFSIATSKHMSYGNWMVRMQNLGGTKVAPTRIRSSKQCHLPVHAFRPGGGQHDPRGIQPNSGSL